MLLQKPLKQGEVVSVRLITGEELIGTLDETTDEYTTVSKPMIVSMNQNGYGLLPFMLTVDPDLKHTIQAQHCMSVVKTNDETSKAYVQSTTSLIV
jgi:hypothetical protein